MAVPAPARQRLGHRRAWPPWGPTECTTRASQGHCTAWPPALCSPGPCEPPQPAFPSGSGHTVGCTHMQMPRLRRQLRVLTVAAPTPGQRVPVPRQGPSGYSSAPFCCLIRLSAAERVAWWSCGSSCREGTRLPLQQMSLDHC